MNRTQQAVRQPITFTLTNTRAVSHEVIGDRRATDEMVSAAQPHFLPHYLNNTAFLRWKFKFIVNKIIDIILEL